MNANSSMHIELIQGFSILKFSGDMDEAMIRKIRPTLECQLKNCRNPNYIIDLGQVSFLDSYGVGLIICLLEKSHTRKGRLAITGATGQPQKLLDIVGFNNTYVQFFNTAEDACTQFAQAS